MLCLLVYTSLIYIWVFSCCMFFFKLQSTLTLQKCSINSLLLLLRQDACMCVSLSAPTCTHEIVQLKELAFSKYCWFKKASLSLQVKDRKKDKKKKKTKTWKENFVSKCSRAFMFYTEGYWHPRWLTGLDVQNSRQPSDYPQPIQSFPQAMGASYFCAQHDRGSVCHTGNVWSLYWLWAACPY